MAPKWLEMVTGPLEEKKQYRQAKARLEGLPEPYGSTAKAFHRYLLMYGGMVEGTTIVTMLGDFADLWERAATDRTPLRDVIGDDPVDFAETFAQAYGGKHWIDMERARLVQVVEQAERPDQG